MAVNRVVEKSTMNLQLENGFTASGQAKMKTYNFSRLNVDATDSNIYGVGVAIADLYQPELCDIGMTQKISLVQSADPEPEANA